MRRRDPAGFTLIELAIVIAVVALLLASAVPAFRNLAERQRLTGAEHQFAAALARAKQAAITQSRDATLCPSVNGRTCLPQGRWHTGWILFADRDEDRDHDRDEPVLLRNAGLDGVTLTSSKWRRKITFQPTGTAGGSNATFTLCVPGAPDKSRAVILSQLGRVRIQATGPGGRELECP